MIILNAINKMDIDGIKEEAGIQHYLRLNGPKGPPIHPALKGPKRVRSI